MIGARLIGVWPWHVDSRLVAWGIVLAALVVVVLVGPEGRARQLEALRRRDGGR